MYTRYDIGYFLYLYVNEADVKGTILEGIGGLFQETCVSDLEEFEEFREFWNTKVHLPSGWMEFSMEEALRQAEFAWKVSFLFDESPI